MVSDIHKFAHMDVELLMALTTREQTRLFIGQVRVYD